MQEEGYEQERTRGRTRRTSDCWTLVGVRRGRAETVQFVRMLDILYRVHGETTQNLCLSLSLLALATRRRSLTTYRENVSESDEAQEEGYE